MLKTKVLVIICVGISVGFLLGMGVSSLLRAMITGGERGLEMTFTALVVLMAGILITYGLKSIPDSRQQGLPGNEIHLRDLQTSPAEVDETTNIPIAAVENGVLNGFQGKPEAHVNGKEEPVTSVPASDESTVN